MIQSDILKHTINKLRWNSNEHSNNLPGGKIRETGVWNRDQIIKW